MNITQNKPGEVRIHGTYPHDDGRQSWTNGRRISPEEAAKLTGATLSSAHRNAHNDGVYMWLNKGYIVLDTPEQGLDQTAAGLLEAFAGSCTRRWPVGTKAVYLCDGHYYLIERC